MLGVVERFLSVRRDVEALATARALPAEAAWAEVAPGVSVAEAPAGAGRTCRWVRLQAGASVPWQSIHRAPEGLFVVEGDIAVDGECRTASHYFFLSSGPHEARTQQGCLLVSLALRA
jgi:mannose-6-phosphate isomerase-like protein (cupin superfamily)